MTWSALAKAMTLTMAGVPASNFSGAPAQTTELGDTILTVPPPVWIGAPLGRAFLSTASARTPIGRPISSLDKTRQPPGAIFSLRRIPLLGVQKTTTCRPSLIPK